MHNKLSLFPSLLFLLTWGTACERLGNQFDKVALECGIADEPQSSREYFRVNSEAGRLPLAELHHLSMNGRSLKDRYTSRSCFHLNKDETGTLYIATQQGRLAYLAQDQRSVRDTKITDILLKNYERITDRLSLQAQMDTKICPDRSRVVYSGSKSISLPLDLRTFGHIAGLVISAEVTNSLGQVSRHDIYTHAGILDAAVDGPSVIQIPFPEEVRSGESFELRIQFRDFSGNEIQTPSCTYIYDKDLPELHAINGFIFHPQRYIESAASSSLELKFASKVPIRNVKLSYRGQGNLLEEVYTPFKRPDNEWRVIAPKPRLAGLQELTIEAESESGSRTRDSVSLHFGERIFLNEGIRTISPAPFENVIIVGTHSGIINVWNLDKKSIIGSYIVEKNFREVLFSPKANYLFVNYPDHLAIRDVRTGTTQNIPGEISQIQVTMDERILVGLRDNALITIDLLAGKVIDELRYETTKVSYIALSPAGQRVAFMNADRRVYAFDLPRTAPPTWLTEIENAGIDRFIISKSGHTLAYNASEKTYRIDFTNNAGPQLVHRFKAGDGIRTLQFSQNEKRLFMGTALGKWVITNLDGSNPYPKTNEAGLEINAYFKGSILQAEFNRDDQSAWIRSDDGQSALFSFPENIAKARNISVKPPRASGLLKDGYYVIQDDGGIELRKLPKVTFVLPLGGQVNSMSLGSSGLIGLGLLPTTPDGRFEAADALTVDPFKKTILARIHHKKAVNSVEISPDGRWMLSASEDNTARLLNLADGTEQILEVSFKNGSRPIRKAMFSHNGRSLAIVIHDKIFIQNLYHLSQEAPVIKEVDWFPTAGFSPNDKEIFGSNGSFSLPGRITTR